ncbi:MAG: 50S ribosomal protein L9 [Muribaculaceae bacterium]|nr:50S ribosomal protein L9 [Muribaculaceae bacterium]
MKIILKEDVANLGYKDDVVEVKNGYGRNYLIPQGKAILATPSALKVLAENLKQRAHKIAKIKADAEAIAATLAGVSLTIPAKVSETGTIYGSVSNIQVAEALEANGHKVDRKIISIKETVKQVGQYVATVRLHKEVAVEIPFEVVAENAPVVEEAPVEAAPAVEAPAVEAPAQEEAPAAE